RQRDQVGAVGDEDGRAVAGVDLYAAADPEAVAGDRVELKRDLVADVVVEARVDQHPAIGGDAGVYQRFGPAGNDVTDRQPGEHAVAQQQEGSRLQWSQADRAAGWWADEQHAAAGQRLDGRDQVEVDLGGRHLAADRQGGGTTDGLARRGGSPGQQLAGAVGA